MRSIRLMIDEELLEELDATEEVRREGRSAVVCRATSEYLRRKKREAIDRHYWRGYRSHSAEAEWKDWVDEGFWPED